MQVASNNKGHLKLLDLSCVPIGERVLHFLQAYESLRPEGSFILISDSNPELFRVQLQDEAPGRYIWLDLEAGPVWRTLVTKRAM